MVFFLQY